MPYALGKVAPHVKDAANHFGPKHGIRVIYGYRAIGSVPNSDHPKGLALDFMTTDRMKGDTLAEDVIANASAWNVTYVIWYRRIWNRGRGWSSYTLSNPHTDHVHVSFGATGGSGQVNDPSENDNPLIPDWAESMLSFFGNVNERIVWLTTPEAWRRIATFSVGAILVLIAIVGWSNMRQAVKDSTTKLKTAGTKTNNITKVANNG